MLMSCMTTRQRAVLVFALVAAGATISSVPGAAQASWAFQLEWEQTGSPPSHFELCVNGSCQPLGGARPVAQNRWRAPLPLLPAGEHRLVVRACGAGQCAAGRPELFIRVLAPNSRRPPIDVVDGPRIPVDRR
jgi:hypothetical protein